MACKSDEECLVWGAFRFASLWSSQELSFGPLRGHQWVSLWDWTLSSRSDLEQGSPAAPRPWTEYALGTAPKLRIRFYMFKWSEKDTSRKILFRGTWKLYGIHIQEVKFWISSIKNSVDVSFLSRYISTSITSPILPLGPQSLKFYPLALHTIFFFLANFWHWAGLFSLFCNF